MVFVASRWSNVMLVTKEATVLVCAGGRVEMSGEDGWWKWVVEGGQWKVGVSEVYFGSVRKRKEYNKGYMECCCSQSTGGTRVEGSKVAEGEGEGVRRRKERGRGRGKRRGERAREREVGRGERQTRRAGGGDGGGETE